MTAGPVSSVRTERTPAPEPTTLRGRLKSAAIVVALIAAMSAPALLIARGAEQGAASFGDSERVGRNSLSAARLDIDIGAQSVPIASSDLAPGDALSGSLELVNEGTVALRYSIAAQPTDDAQQRALAEWLGWRFVWSGDGRSCDTTDGSRPLTVTGPTIAGGVAITGDPATGADPGDRILQPGERDLLCIEMSFALDASNSVQATRYSQGFTAFAEQLPVDPTGEG